MTNAYKDVNGFLLKDDETRLISQIMPEKYVYENMSNLDKTYALRFLQNELNYLLNSFLNGGFSNRGYVLYPLIKDISKENLKRIKRLKGLVLFLNNGGYDFSRSIASYKKAISSKTFAALISSLYSDFAAIDIKGNKIAVKHACANLDLKAYDKADLDYINPLSELQAYAKNHLKQCLLGFYIHGSLATNDYIKGWSDADIYKSSRLRQASALVSELR